jgi:hypothetical protein
MKTANNIILIQENEQKLTILIHDLKKSHWSFRRRRRSVYNSEITDYHVLYTTLACQDKCYFQLGPRTQS